ncbi:MAG: hypothetical protein C0596_10430 [Marinilabiliales bacterium]|nr:MAG: hypothetical protein C0596_10430 [Marinilabiliales bacterium]
MKRNLISIITLAMLSLIIISCNNQERKINKEGVESDKISVKSSILDEYGQLMPNCKNMLTVDVEGIDIADALVYIDNDAGDAYMETEGVGLVPYEASNSISMIVSFEEEGGTKEFEVADKTPAPQVRFFNAETNVIQDYDIENVTAVVVEVVADDKFAELFPEDSEYVITSFTAKQMRGEEELNSIIVESDYSNNQIDLSNLQENAQTDDVIVVSITGLQRIDFEGNAHDVEIPEKMQEINLTVQ